MIQCRFIMYLKHLLLLFFTTPYIIANDITILTDWQKVTLHCMNHFFENTRYLTKDDTNVILFGLDDKERVDVRKITLRNDMEIMPQYHQTYKLRELGEKYYSKLIRALNLSKKTFLLFGEKSTFNNPDAFQQNNKNVEIVWCKNGICENCEEQKPIALAIVNQVLETTDTITDQQNQPKSKASDKSWSDGIFDGEKSFILELSSSSVLTGMPGEIVKLYFKIKNLRWIPLEYNFHCYDQLGLIRSVMPTSIIIPPNTDQFVTVVLEVTGPEGSNDQISFSVLQPEFESIKVNFYIGQLTGDTTRPTIEYRFNGDCRYADTPHTCASEKWNIEATIQDENSGLAVISSIPNHLRFRNEFCIGTREPVIVYYSATCCFPKIEITAIDLRGNKLEKTINAEKQYLNVTEISLIVLSIIILLLIILLLIWGIIRCQRKKKSRDFLSS